MNESLKAFSKQLREFWRDLSTSKRLALVLGTSMAMVAVLVLSLLNSRITYGYLYTELGPEDASAIVAELKRKNIPHRLEAAGTALMVPDDQRHSLRLELASEGLPRGGAIGFELFDRAQIGATEFEQQVSLRRALEGELSRSISSVEGVRSARVHLVMPERRLFAMREDNASASVVVKLRNAGSFGKHEVAGIVHLVAAAVPGLTRDRISVVSTEGVTLHRPSNAGGGGVGLDGSDSRAEQERAVATRLENEAREQLERVVGSGNADVRINVMLDAAATERTEEHWDPGTTALRSEHLVEEGVDAAEAGVAGVPGARTNLPDAPAEGAAAPDDRQGEVVAGMRRARTRNWEVDRVTKKTSLPPGGIVRLSVAVLLNGTHVGDGPDAQFIPRPVEQVQALEQIVRRAVGFDAQRGDSILVQAAQFARPALPEDLDPQRPWWHEYLPHAIAGATGLFILCALVLVWRGRKTTKTKERQLAEARQVIDELQQAQTPAALSEGYARELPTIPTEEQKRAIAIDLASQDPASAALVLKKWLASS